MMLCGQNIYSNVVDQHPLYTLQIDEKVAFYQDVAIVIHQDREPLLIRKNGKIEILRYRP